MCPSLPTPPTPAQDIIPRHPAHNPAVQRLYCGTVGGGPGSEPARALLHTTYRRRDGSTVMSPTLASDW